MLDLLLAVDGDHLQVQQGDAGGLSLEGEDVDAALANFLEPLEALRVLVVDRLAAKDRPDDEVLARRARLVGRQRSAGRGGRVRAQHRLVREVAVPAVLPAGRAGCAAIFVRVPDQNRKVQK